MDISQQIPNSWGDEEEVMENHVEEILHNQEQVNYISSSSQSPPADNDEKEEKYYQENEDGKDDDEEEEEEVVVQIIDTKEQPRSLAGLGLKLSKNFQVPTNKVYTVTTVDDIICNIHGNSKEIFCIVCYIKSGPTKCKRSKEGGNHLKHFRTHVKHEHMNQLTMDTIEEFKGCVLNYAKPRTMMSFIKTEGTTITPEDKFVGDVANFLLRHGLNLSVVETTEFRMMINTTRSLKSTYDSDIGRIKMETAVLKKYEMLKKKNLDLLETGTAYTIMFDCLDVGKHHFLGASLSFISVDKNGILKLNRFPILFRELKGTTHEMDEYEIAKRLDEGYDFSTIHKTYADHNDIKVVIANGFKELTIPWSKCVAAKSDGAGKKAAKSVFKNSTMEMPTTSNIFGETEDKCLAHDLGLVAKYLLGISKVKNQEKSKIPPPASDVIMSSIDHLRKLISTCSDPLAWSQIMKFAKSKGQGDPTIINVDMEVRWLSTWEMIKGFLDNYYILNEFCSSQPGMKTHHSNVFKETTHSFWAQLEGVLDPLMLVTASLNLNKPMSPFILPLIFSLFAKYGINVSDGILDQSKLAPAKTIEELDTVENFVFFVRNEANEKQIVKFADFQRKPKELVRAMQSHLIYRLSKLRVNKNGLEILATYADPTANRFFQKICGAHHENLQKECDSIIIELGKGKHGNKSHPTTSTTTSTTTNNLNEEPEFILSSNPKGKEETEADEKVNFKNYSNSRILGLDNKNTPRNLLYHIETCDPLITWSDSKLKTLLPGYYEANLITLGYPPGTLYQESIFSSIGDTLDNRRYSLTRSAAKMEAIVLSRILLAQEALFRKEESKRKGTKRITTNEETEENKKEKLVKE